MTIRDDCLNALEAGDVFTFSKGVVDLEGPIDVPVSGGVLRGDGFSTTLRVITDVPGVPAIRQLGASTDPVSLYVPDPIAPPQTVLAAEGAQQALIPRGGLTSLGLNSIGGLVGIGDIYGLRQVATVQAIWGNGIAPYEVVVFAQPLAEPLIKAASPYLIRITPGRGLVVSDLAIDGAEAGLVGGSVTPMVPGPAPGGIELRYTRGARIERTEHRHSHGAALWALAGWGTVVRDVLLDQAADPNYADLWLTGQSGFSVETIRSERSPGFGPLLQFCNHGSVRDVQLTNSVARAMKIEYGAYISGGDVRSLGSFSTGFTLSFGTHHVALDGLIVTGTNRNNSSPGAAIWLDGINAGGVHHNRLTGVVARSNGGTTLAINPLAHNNYVEGVIDQPMSNQGPNNTVVLQ